MSHYFPKRPGRPAGLHRDRRPPTHAPKNKQAGRKVAPASLLRRLSALSLDGMIGTVFLLIVMVLAAVLWYVFSIDKEAFIKSLQASVLALNANPWLKTLAVLLGSMIYPAVSYMVTGGSTPGKKLLGLRIVDRQTGQKVSMVKFVLRNSVGLSLSGLLFGFGYLLVFFSKERLALHDLIFATQVVRLL